MRIAILKEKSVGEKRIGATPETVKKLIAAGFQVAVESGAGDTANISDGDFQAAGAQVEPNHQALLSSADILLKVQAPTDEELTFIREKTLLISFVYPLNRPDLVRKLSQKKLTVFAIDLVPRIARAQKMDALSSQSNISGYKAVLMAADALGKMMPMMMTAAGTVSPARVLILGAGVAGLQAIATAKRLGAIVEAYDTRPVVKEQVESLGARFIELAIQDKETEDKSGYAKALSKESHEAELRGITERVKASDIVITTALIPGKKAPLLITEEAVRQMKKGSVIVDLAAEAGGNCALTEAGKSVVKDGVYIIGELNVPSLLAQESSRLYARNVMHLVNEISKASQLEFKREDEIIQSALILLDGEIVHPKLKQVLSEADKSSGRLGA